MANKVGGVAQLLINGVQYPLRGNITASLGNVSRESIVGLDKYHGIKETPQVSWVEMDITDLDTLDLNTIEALADVTVNILLDNGKAGVLRNAYQVNKLELNVADGLFTARFEGPNGEWV